MKKMVLIRGALALGAVLLIVFILASHHVVWKNNFPLLVKRESLGFSEAVTNFDEIMELTWEQRIQRYPLTVKGLDRQKILPCDFICKTAYMGQAIKQIEPLVDHWIEQLKETEKICGTSLKQLKKNPGQSVSMACCAALKKLPNLRGSVPQDIKPCSSD